MVRVVIPMLVLLPIVHAQSSKANTGTSAPQTMSSPKQPQVDAVAAKFAEKVAACKTADDKATCSAVEVLASIETEMKAEGAKCQELQDAKAKIMCHTKVRKGWAMLQAGKTRFETSECMKKAADTAAKRACAGQSMVALKEQSRKQKAEYMKCTAAATKDQSKLSDCKKQRSNEVQNNQKEKDAAASKAAKALSTCSVAAAADAKAKAACLTIAKDDMATAFGMTVEKMAPKFNAVLKQLQERDAQQGAATKMSGCYDKKDAAATKKCRIAGLPDVKQKLAAARGKDASKVKDSDVRKAVCKGANTAAGKAYKDCVALGNGVCEKTCRDACKAEAKVVQDASGPECEKPESALKGQVTSSMKDTYDACIGEAKEALKSGVIGLQEMKECQDLAKETYKTLKIGSKTATEKMRDVHQKAIQDKAESLLDCTDDADPTSCTAKIMVEVKEALKNMLGKTKVGDSEVKRAVQKAAANIAQEALKSCNLAKKDNATASCDDHMKILRVVSGKKAPTDPKKQKMEEAKSKRGIAKSVMDKARSACWEDDTKTKDKATLKSCLDGVQAGAKEDIKKMYGSSKSAQFISKKVKRAEQEADKERFGVMFKSCMEDQPTADAAAKKTAFGVCMTKINNVAKTGPNAASGEDQVTKFQADLFKAVADCEGAKAKTCRAEAKATAKENGVKASQVLHRKRQGEFRAAAEAWAECKEAATDDTSITDADCEAAAKEQFKLVSGATKWTDKEKKKAKVLAEAQLAGVATEIRKRKPNGITIAVVTTEATCNAPTPDILQKKITAFNAGLVKCEPSCREVDGTAEYTMGCPVPPALSTDVQVQDLAEGAAQMLTPAVVGRLLSNERRLSTVTIKESGATQTTEECPTTDTNCGSGAGSGTTFKAGSGTPKAGSGTIKAGSNMTTSKSASSSGSVMPQSGSLLAFGLVTFIVSMV